jgi:hypothetical protein
VTTNFIFTVNVRIPDIQIPDKFKNPTFEYRNIQILTLVNRTTVAYERSVDHLITGQELEWKIQDCVPTGLDHSKTVWKLNGRTIQTGHSITGSFENPTQICPVIQ